MDSDNQEEGSDDTNRDTNKLVQEDILDTGSNKGSGNFQCGICKKDFSSKCKAKGHIKRVHISIKTNQHLCDQCRNKFTQIHSLILHIKREHCEEVTPKDRGVYSSMICTPWGERMKGLVNQGRKPKKWQRKRKERKVKLKREINGWIYEGNGEAILEKNGE